MFKDVYTSGKYRAFTYGKLHILKYHEHIPIRLMEQGGSVKSGYKGHLIYQI